jgi:hypothetical protein
MVKPELLRQVQMMFAIHLFKKPRKYVISTKKMFFKATLIPTGTDLGSLIVTDN